ncbi:MAG: hypothetical protein JNJ40_16725 [Bacteroidia bacterium]|nr:hypothetical protein [Bacteroidia bacterium]
MGKNFTLLFLFIVANIGAQTSAPKFINYQGVARDASGSPVTTAFDIRFTITNPATTVHIETQTNLQPNQFGLFSTLIGAANTLTPAVWNTGPYTLHVEIKTGNTFIPVGSQQLVSVPFSLFSGDVPTSYTNNILTIGSKSYNLSAAAASPTIYGTGAAIVTPSTGTTFTVDVPPATINFSGNILNFNQGTTSTSATYSPNLSGDAIGSISNTTVTALRNVPIANITPTNGQSLIYNGTAWTPSTVVSATIPATAWIKSATNVTLAVASDNVGIGVALPIAKLDVAGSATTTGGILNITNTNASNSSPIVTINSNGSNDVLTVTQTGAAANAGNFNSNNGQALLATSSSSVGHAIQATSNNTSTATYAGLFDGGIVARGKTNTTSGYGLRIQNLAFTDIFGVRNDGFVGVGDVNPTTRLLVSGSNISTFPNGFSASPETAIRIHNDDITNNNFSSLIFSTRASNFSLFEGAKIVAAYTDHTNSSGDLLFFTRSPANLFERMRLTSSGRLGIGTTSPTGELDVAGKTVTDSLQLTTPSTPTSGAVLISRDGAGNTKWMTATAFKGSFVPQTPITINAAVQTNIGNTAGGYTSSTPLNACPSGFGISFLASGVRFVVPETGIYQLESAIMVAINPSATGNLYVAYEIFNQTSNTVLVRSMQSNQDNSITVNTVIDVSTTSLLTKNDIIILRISGSLANSGTISNAFAGTDKMNYFSGHLIR